MVKQEGVMDTQYHLSWVEHYRGLQEDTSLPTKYKQNNKQMKDHKNWQEAHEDINQNDRNPHNSIIKLSKAFDDVHASKLDPNRKFPFHRTYTVHTEQQTDERTTKIDKKLMEIDQNDWNPSNSIILLSKAFDDVHTSKSDPNRTVSVPPYLHSTCWKINVWKKLMEFDQNYQNPCNSIIQLRNAPNFLGKTQWNKWRRKNNPGSWTTCNTSVIHGRTWLQTMMAKLFLKDSCISWGSLTSKLTTTPPCFLGHGAQWIQSCS